MNDNAPQKDTLIGKGVLPLVEVMQLLQRPGVSLPVRIALKRDGKKQQGVVSLTVRFDADDSALATAAAAVAAATAVTDAAGNSDSHLSNELLELRITGLKAEGLANTEVLSFVNKQDPYVKAAIGGVYSNSSFTANGAGTSAVWHNAVLKVSLQLSVLAAAGAKLQLVSHAVQKCVHYVLLHIACTSVYNRQQLSYLYYIAVFLEILSLAKQFGLTSGCILYTCMYAHCYMRAASTAIADCNVLCYLHVHVQHLQEVWDKNVIKDAPIGDGELLLSSIPAQLYLAEQHGKVCVILHNTAC
jgi:hypothetical protein